ncbi:MAG: hypothetical protein RJA59_2137 [Pseudomonadota bacterium]
MGQLSANLLAALQKPQAKAVRILELTLPTGTYRYSSTPLLSGGVYSDRVLGWGPLERGVAKQPSLDPFETEVTLADTDQQLSKLIESSTGHLVRNSAAVIKLACEGLASGDWFTLFSGRIEAYQQAGPLSWTVRLRPQDLPLNRESCPKPVINRSDWPNCPAENVGLRAPIIYGKHDSVSGTNAGAVPLILVDPLAFRYLVCAGHTKAVHRVYSDGVPVAGWSAEYRTVNGRLYTCVTFTTSQDDAGVSADVEGLESTGDGTGTLLEDPPTVLKHLLVNWIYGDWKSGAWLADSTAPVDTTTFATTFFSARGYSCSRRFSRVRKGIDHVNEFLSSLEAKATWTWGGRIALLVENPAVSSIYATGLVLDGRDVQGWGLDYPTGTLIDRVDGDWLYDENADLYVQALQVRDVSLSEEAPDSVSLPWSPSYVV